VLVFFCRRSKHRREKVKEPCVAGGEEKGNHSRVPLFNSNSGANEKGGKGGGKHIEDELDYETRSRDYSKKNKTGGKDLMLTRGF